MKNHQIRFFVLFPALLLLLFTDSDAAGITMEPPWPAQLRERIDIGQVQELPSQGLSGGDSSFFSIFTEHATGKPKGAIILLHDIGAHPDWQAVIHPLRTRLPDKGWASLAIQLPVSTAELQDENTQKQLIESALPRIDAAIAFLNQKTYKRIILIGHGFGALSTLNFLQAKADVLTPEDLPLIHAAVIIGTPSYGTAIPGNSPAMIAKISIPLLDLYGSRDTSNVLHWAKARKTAARQAGNKRFRQTETIGANHFYHGLDDELVNTVYHWLNKTLKSSG